MKRKKTLICKCRHEDEAITVKVVHYCPRCGGELIYNAAHKIEQQPKLEHKPITWSDGSQSCKGDCPICYPEITFAPHKGRKLSKGKLVRFVRNKTEEAWSVDLLVDDLITAYSNGNLFE